MSDGHINDKKTSHRWNVRYRNIISFFFKILKIKIYVGEKLTRFNVFPRLISRYKTKEEFVYDVRQIFNNCETFNEDDSPVGKAGHAMRSFFETKWGELTNQKSTP